MVGRGAGRHHGKVGALQTKHDGQLSRDHVDDAARHEKRGNLAHAARGTHRRQERPDAVHDAEHVDVVDAPPLRQWRLLEAAEKRDAGKLLRRRLSVDKRELNPIEIEVAPIDL